MIEDGNFLGGKELDKDENKRQAELEVHAEKTVVEYNEGQKDNINGMMKIELSECSYDDRTLTFIFPVQQWQANRAGHLHGGIICTAFDITTAALARFYAGENFAPTVSLDVKFLRPVNVGDRLIVKAVAPGVGRRITHMTCEGYSESTGKLSALGAAVYMNVDTVKEREKS